MLLVTAFFISCSKDEEPCTFEEEPTCFCAENPADVKCCTFESDADCFCSQKQEDAQCVAREQARLCSTFDRSVMYIRWRNNTNAGDFSWARMNPVQGQNGIFEISQQANVFYTADGTEPNFGAQIVEFSNQPDYGGLNNGQPWQLYRNWQNGPDPARNWDFPAPVNGVTSKTAYFITVSTRNAQGVETVLCPRPAEVTQANGFRLLFNQNGQLVISKNSRLTYTINANTGEVALRIQELDPCENFDRSEMFIRWRDTPNAGNFTWAQMAPVAGSPGIFRISQPASRWVAEGGTGPNFGAQILEFSNQPDYGGRNDGKPWSLYRNWQNAPDPAKNWDFPAFVNGVTSKKAYYISVSTRNSQGVETIVCPRPADVTQANGFRFFLIVNGQQVIPNNATVTYTIDSTTGEVAVSFQ